jgi:hypothetical protein
LSLNGACPTHNLTPLFSEVPSYLLPLDAQEFFYPLETLVVKQSQCGNQQ